MPRALAAAAVLALAGCEQDGGTPCTDPGAVTGTLVATPTRQPVTSDLVVRGTIMAPGNATVYGVQVNGVDATSTSNDFRSWSATMPIGVLAAQSMNGSVTLSATAFTNCGAQPSEVGSSAVKVDAMPGIVVNQLTVTPTIPDGQSYLPSSKPVSAVVAITGNAQAAGQVVAVTTRLGKLSAPQVTLAGDGTADATAQVLFSSDAPGIAVIIAAAMGKTGDGTVTVIGPPTFAPDGTTIPAGASLRVTVLTTGKIDSCQATPASGIHVISGTDLMQGTGGVDQTMDGLIDIDISADAGITAATSTTVSCRDPFGQVGTATFTGQPTSPP